MAADIDRDAFEAKIQGLSSPETKSVAMTLAQSLRREGHQEGRQEGLRLGRQLALQEAVFDVLATRFSRVPEGLRDTIVAVRDEATLQTLHRAAIECPSLEVFANRL